MRRVCPIALAGLKKVNNLDGLNNRSIFALQLAVKLLITLRGGAVGSSLGS